MKRLVIAVATIALLASVAAPVGAKQTEPPPPPTVPETVVLEDPFGDANFLNDQGQSGQVGFQGDNGTPADAGNASDIGKVWFTDDAATISAHIQTELPPPGSQGLRFDVYTGSGPDSALGCIRFVAVFEGIAQGQSTTWQGPTMAKFFDACNDGTNWFSNGVEATLAFGALEDGTGYITITAPKEASPLVATGQSLAGTTVTSRVLTGEQGAANGSLSAPYIDNTKQGADYLITGGPEVEEEEPKLPPGCTKGKGKKKGCKKGKAKGKKKGACARKKSPEPEVPAAPAACPAYVPGEQGAEAQTSVVTETATEEAPLEVTIAAPAGNPVSLPASFHNIQVDAPAAEAGLYVRYEFPVQDDHDIYLNYADGSEAAHAAGFNPAPFIPNNGVFWTDGTGAGGHSEQGAEVLDGIRTADCSGYTLQMDSFLTQGGDMTLKLWLGEAQNDPAPPSDGGDALATFWSLVSRR